MRIIAFVVAAVLAVPAAAATPPKPLFAAEDTIHIAIQGPFKELIRTRSSQPRPGELAIGNETLPVNLSVRGITRRMADICQFPPIRVEFTRPPPPTSLFAGQKRLKLVTHCNNSASFQQYLLLEYAAYRMYQQLTPLSFRARLANVDYIDADHRPIITRWGFFLEDTGDVARRNGLHEVHAPDVIPVSSLSPRDAARYTMFEHMIGNHDWSMHAGPKGEDCCHNAKLVGGPWTTPGATIPIPYDFDFSGFVGTPYATPPDELHISNVRTRFFRGYCFYNNDSAAVAAQMRAAQPQLLAALAGTPGLEPKTLGRAQSYLDGFFREIASDAAVAALLKHCSR
ncbi:MAG TPA: hypothetical protein VF067_00040 [Sphingomicrobium sp.]